MNVTPRRRIAFPVKVAKNTCFMLTLTRHEIHHAHKYPNLYSHAHLHDNTTLVAWKQTPSCQRDVTHQYKQIQNGGTETM